jgi:hypothetical protein
VHAASAPSRGQLADVPLASSLQCSTARARPKCFCLEMHMRKPELALVQLLLLSFIAAAAGCGSDSKSSSPLDGGRDSSSNVPDTDKAKADQGVAADTGKSDTAPRTDTVIVDATSADASEEVDADMADLPLVLDASPDNVPLDTGTVEAPPRMDAVDMDGALASEAGGGMDGLAVDSLETSMATITFRLQNTGPQTVYLRSDCWIRVDVTSEADATVYANGSFCACACADTTCTSPVECSPCAPSAGVAIEAGKTKDISWIARKSTMETKNGSTGAFQCVAHSPIPTGAYRVTVVVYSTQSDAAGGTNGKAIEQSFTLSPADATVMVPVR